MIELGQKAKDKITGFEGILTARVQYLTGCDQYCIAPPAKDSKIPDSCYFDEGRIEIMGSGILQEEVIGEKNGGFNIDCPGISR